MPYKADPTEPEAIWPPTECNDWDQTWIFDNMARREVRIEFVQQLKELAWVIIDETTVGQRRHVAGEIGDCRSKERQSLDEAKEGKQSLNAKSEMENEMV
ncbi:hypothetical protein N7481_011139 [Penicillium waksmanii]|uniref:uncharacterized protein n=1 Tax=Penicillium waksmanii TaxID=69791 RepID=UPI0025474A09|nr:uncharacterized protein N7481_011139 [Penicillium waksmanii]KAJ5973929.1 hypothetical protein N7481_011139 [Penicillium waksmanii]